MSLTPFSVGQSNTLFVRVKTVNTNYFYFYFLFWELRVRVSVMSQCHISVTSHDDDIVTITCHTERIMSYSMYNIC